MSIKNLDKSLKNDGYCFLKKIIPINLINSLQSYASEMLNCDNSPKDIINTMSKLEISDKKKFYFFCKEMGNIIPSIKISMIKDILFLIEEIFKNSNIYLTDSAIFFNKIDVTRLQYDWHTEKSYFPKAQEVITLWFPWLHEVNTNNGTMILAKGSHKKKFNAKKIIVKNGLTQMKIDEKDLKKYEFIPCNLTLGDCVLFKLRTAHRTGPNRSGIPRSTMIIRFTNYKGKFNSG